MYASDFREKARIALKGRWAKLSLLMLLAGLLGGSVGVQWPTDYLNDVQKIINYYRFAGLEGMDAGYVQLILRAAHIRILFLAIRLLYGLLLGGFVSVGLVGIGLETLDGTPLMKAVLFPTDCYGKALRLNLLRGLIIFLGSLLLVVPGVIAAHSYAMAEYLLLQHPEMGVVEILRESRKRMKGYKDNLFCLQLSFIGWKLLAALPGLVLIYYGTSRYSSLCGAILALLLNCIVTPYMNTAIAAFYRCVDRGGENGGDYECRTDA